MAKDVKYSLISCIEQIEENIGQTQKYRVI